MERSLSLTIKNDKKATDLHLYAYRNDRENVIKYLDQNGGEINTRDSKGKTALFLASSYGRQEIVDIMLQRTFCDPNIPDNKGNTPLHEAVEKGDLNIVKSLVESGKKARFYPYTSYIGLHYCDALPLILEVASYIVIEMHATFAE